MNNKGDIFMYKSKHSDLLIISVVVKNQLARELYHNGRSLLPSGFDYRRLSEQFIIRYE